MPERRSADPLGFLRRQRDAVRRQCAAVERGDVQGALSLSGSLTTALSSLPGMMAGCFDSDDSDNGARSEAKSLIADMVALEKTAVAKLKTERERLAQILRKIRMGRQVLTGYYSGRDKNHRLFEISG